MEDKQTLGEVFVEGFLEHHGVKGMKWGVRKSKSELRDLNRASRQKDREARDKAIDKARARVSSGKTKANFKQAKQNYKHDKLEIGSREARKILNKARAKRTSDIETSQLAKSGKEKATALIAAGVSLATIVAMQAAQNR